MVVGACWSSEVLIMNMMPRSSRRLPAHMCWQSKSFQFMNSKVTRFKGKNVKAGSTGSTWSAYRAAYPLNPLDFEVMCSAVLRYVEIALGYWFLEFRHVQPTWWSGADAFNVVCCCLGWRLMEGPSSATWALAKLWVARHMGWAGVGATTILGKNQDTMQRWPRADWKLQAS